jgi:Flp pilus assembly protein TadG
MSLERVRKRLAFGRLLRSQDGGQAMVEFTLILPAFLVMVFAVVDFGRAYSAYVTITNAAREGARYGIAAPTDSAGITSRVQSTAGSYNDSNLTVTVSCNTSCTSGQDVVVTAKYNLSLITPLAGVLKLLPGSNNINSTFTLQSTADMRIE